MFNTDHSNPQYLPKNLFQLFYSRIHIYKKKKVAKKSLYIYTHSTINSNSTPFYYPLIFHKRRSNTIAIFFSKPTIIDHRPPKRKKIPPPPPPHRINFQITGGQRSVRSFKYNFPDYFSGLDVGRSRNNVAVIDRHPVRDVHEIID